MLWGFELFKLLSCFLLHYSGEGWGRWPHSSQVPISAFIDATRRLSLLVFGSYENFHAHISIQTWLEDRNVSFLFPIWPPMTPWGSGCPCYCKAGSRVPTFHSASSTHPSWVVEGPSLLPGGVKSRILLSFLWHHPSRSLGYSIMAWRKWNLGSSLKLLVRNSFPGLLVGEKGILLGLLLFASFGVSRLLASLLPTRIHEAKSKTTTTKKPRDIPLYCSSGPGVLDWLLPSLHLSKYSYVCFLSNVQVLKLCLPGEIGKVYLFHICESRNYKK